MSEVKRKVLVLDFNCQDGSTRSLTINKPSEELSGQVISSTMDEIIACGALAHIETGSLVKSKKAARYVVQEEDTVAL